MSRRNFRVAKDHLSLLDSMPRALLTVIALDGFGVPDIKDVYTDGSVIEVGFQNETSVFLVNPSSHGAGVGTLTLVMNSGAPVPGTTITFMSIADSLGSNKANQLVIDASGISTVGWSQFAVFLNGQRAQMIYLKASEVGGQDGWYTLNPDKGALIT